MMIDTSGFPSSPRNGFPTGLRVLVVDDDLTWLKILEKMLKKCFYEVTTCCLAREALRILRERKEGFDIVISDVNMPDTDGFKLLEHVGLEMDLPVIMMSVDGETSRVMKGVQHGACDYLLKPIRMKELRNIWQHVLRKRINDVRNVENYGEAIQMMRIGNDQSQSNAAHYYLSDMSATRKRKDVDNKHIDSTEMSDAFAKRARVVWTVDLHQKFVKAVKLMGIEKIGPKKILDSMNVPWLTRENVASHLQKYRLYLSRLQREKGDKPFEISTHLDVDFCRLKHSDISTNDNEEVSFVTREKNLDAGNGVSSSNRYSSVDLNVNDAISKSFMLQGLNIDSNGGLYADALEPRNKKIQHSESVESGAQFANIIPKNSGTGELRVDHYENLSKQHQWVDDGFNHWPSRPQQNIRKSALSVNEGSTSCERRIVHVTAEPDPRADHLNCSLSAKSLLKRETSSEIYPLHAEQETHLSLISGKAPLVPKFDNAFDGPYTPPNLPQSPHTPSPSVYLGAFTGESRPVKSMVPCTEQASRYIVNVSSLQKADALQEARYLEHQSFNPADSELALVAFGKDYKIQWDQSEGVYDFHDSNETDDLMASVPVHLYDALRFDWWGDAPGCPMMDQSLSIVDTAHFTSSSYPVT